MDWLADFIADLITRNAHYRGIIYTATAVEAGLVWLVVLALRYQAMHEERWAKYFGWAFFLFFVQSTVAITYGYLSLAVAPAHRATPYWMELAFMIASPINSLLFYAAAQALLLRRRLLSPYLIGLAFVVVAVSSAAEFSDHESLTTWHRLPDALLSAICITWLGYSMFRCIRGGRVWDQG